MAPAEVHARLRRVSALLFAGSGGLSLSAGALLASSLRGDSSPSWFAVAVVAGLVAAGGFLLWTLLRLGAGLRPGLILDARGLDHRVHGFVAWGEVDDLRLIHRVGKGHWLRLRTASPASVQRRGPSWLLSSPRIALEFPVGVFDQPPELLYAAARALHEQAVWDLSLKPAGDGGGLQV